MVRSVSATAGTVSNDRAFTQGWRTPALAPGESLRVRVAISLRRSGSRPWTLPLKATRHGLTDRVSVLLRP